MAQEDFEKRAMYERQFYEMQGIHNTENANINYHQGKALYGDIIGGSLSAGLPSQVKHTMAVVTLIVGIDGDSTQIPEFHSTADVTQSLNRLASHAKVEDCLRSVEILWTPSSDECLQPRDIEERFPGLQRLQAPRAKDYSE